MSFKKLSQSQILSSLSIENNLGVVLNSLERVLGFVSFVNVVDVMELFGNLAILPVVQQFNISYPPYFSSVINAMEGIEESLVPLEIKDAMYDMFIHLKIRAEEIQTLQLSMQLLLIMLLRVALKLLVMLATFLFIHLRSRCANPFISWQMSRVRYLARIRWARLLFNIFEPLFDTKMIFLAIITKVLPFSRRWVITFQTSFCFVIISLYALHFTYHMSTTTRTRRRELLLLEHVSGQAQIVSAALIHFHFNFSILFYATFLGLTLVPRLIRLPGTRSRVWLLLEELPMATILLMVDLYQRF